MEAAPSSGPSCTTCPRPRSRCRGVPDRPGVAAGLFRQLADADINVDMIVQNVSERRRHRHLLHGAPRRQLDEALAVVRGPGRRDRRRRGALATTHIAKVSVVGAGMKSNPGVAATMFEALADDGINIEMISTSAIRITCVVGEDDADRAVQVLHDAYELDQTTF